MEEMEIDMLGETKKELLSGYFTQWILILPSSLSKKVLLKKYLPFSLFQKLLAIEIIENVSFFHKFNIEHLKIVYFLVKKDTNYCACI